VVGSEIGFIYVNVRGRGPLGCVEPGAEFEALRTDIISRFRALVDRQTGKQLLARVCRGEEIYSAPGEGVLLPDIVLVPCEGYVVGAGFHEPFLPATGERGDHRHNGILLISGPELRSSVHDFSPRLIDLAPTILHAVGLAIPSDMDGRVLKELFRDPRPVRIEAADNYELSEARDYGAPETELLEQRLRALGYVE
jgi:predicted AlkP superfamily phosphohydrolase/phosphomutase